MEISDDRLKHRLRTLKQKAKCNSMADEPARLRIVSFALHSARGVIRDQSTRRRVMFITLMVAMFMLFSGTTFLQPLLSPREHPGWFLLFWLACAWLTLTALLLALFDLLMLRARERAARKILREKVDHD
ncbi:MAG: hypothetical protein DME43_01220 [Verrucomicrobia bacterium]|nr:MAG: hypothetical protein DME43_01220 [Verrucomicrobiota bacterium]PYK73241.1 MAG: hypothetical protein DME44_01935 [Verrucomicrobiota bacterium]